MLEKNIEKIVHSEKGFIYHSDPKTVFSIATMAIVRHNHICNARILDYKQKNAALKIN